MKHSGHHGPSPIKEIARVKLAGFGLALLGSGLVLLVYQALSLRSALRADATVQADMIADNVSAALMFDDERSAQEVLHSLSKVPYIESAGIYTMEGKRFASYARPGLSARDAGVAIPSKVRPIKHALSFDDMWVASAIAQNGKMLGSVVVVAESELRKAIEADALHLVYQPQFDCRTSSVIGAEALLRWVHPVDGEIAPSEFVPVAEDSDLIVALGQWVLRRACRDAAHWNVEQGGRVYVAVNVSARQLRQGEFNKDVEAVLAESGLSPHLLELELTESQLMANMTAGVEAMRQLRAAGIRLSLDDFGTGYSSLSYLQSFPVNNLKIDRAFVKPLPEAGQPIVTAIISMAHSFGIAVVAEGVEEPAQLAWLCEAGCDIVQGYLTGRPMSSEGMTDLLRKACANPEPLP